ncbi:MAG: hypothetical protein GY896_13470 [Gammaproteobacteria bacterium]|nr:hypothetical protein [Gammaproteobacteria bacterium]
MNITVEFDDKSYILDVPAKLALEADEFFEKMDRDMNCGWQMSRWWVPEPDQNQRCQIVADKLLIAMQDGNEEFALLMCAYILKNKPATKTIRINTDGEIQGNEIIDE